MRGARRKVIRLELLQGLGQKVVAHNLDDFLLVQSLPRDDAHLDVSERSPTLCDVVTLAGVDGVLEHLAQLPPRQSYDTGYMEPTPMPAAACREAVYPGAWDWIEYHRSRHARFGVLPTIQVTKEPTKPKREKKAKRAKKVAKAPPNRE